MQRNFGLLTDQLATAYCRVMGLPTLEMPLEAVHDGTMTLPCCEAQTAVY